MHSPLIYNFPFAPSVAKRGFLGYCDNGLIILAVSSAGSHTEPVNKEVEVPAICLLGSSQCTEQQV